MQLNAQRIRLQRAIDIARGMALAQRPGKLPDGYADAEAVHADDAEEIEFQVNADRKWDEAVASMGQR